MLEPREADIPILFLVLVVLPLVAYILLGKWSETSKKRQRINLLAQLAAEESLRAEVIPVTVAVPVISTSKNGSHVCARCFSPATTRCSRCKSARYCSEKCQIVHWMQVHKQECQELESTDSCLSLKNMLSEDSLTERASVNESLNSFYFGCNNKQAMMVNESSVNSVDPPISACTSVATNCSEVDTSQEAMLQRRSTDKQFLRKSNRDMLRRWDGAALDSLAETSESKPTVLSKYNNVSTFHISGKDTAHENPKYLSQHEIFSESRRTYGPASALHYRKNGINVHETESDFISSGQNLSIAEDAYNDGTVPLKCYDEAATMKGSIKTKSARNSTGTKLSKSKPKVKVPEEPPYSEIEGKAPIADNSKIPIARDAIPATGSNGAASINIMKIMGLKKSTKHSRHDVVECKSMHKKIRMLFPYEEYMKIFNCEVVSLSPRGLINCGNSCYANAVLQCLTCTKPLTIFLLQRAHSRNCCGKDWCLICELEQHVTMLRECGSPLSPSRILLHMRNTNSQIGDGSQEDAHEFLRLLVASMQSICLEGLGGEEKVDPRLQETTFIQHTFGGRLRSKVKCLRCNHVSERYENIMDLTLEIFGWVESLEDALTQFTTPEELDGDNMYRCGRCGTYARARKQLRIHEAPNILTIVLKRFQEGEYGKINKCITFPDMLDMIPYMTRMGDIPPLYILYAVVVHLDTFNASFSGHYVAYVKDLRGSWFRIDDTEVQPVPMSQVMSEGAYMLFYTRSCPRPPKSFHEKAIAQEVPVSARRCTSRAQKPSRQVQSKSGSYIVCAEPSMDFKPENGKGFMDQAAYGVQCNAGRSMEKVMEFSDVTSSDWSLFTSSDDASFTTESTRDSFSTVDYADTCNADTFSAIFSNLYAPEPSSLNALCCRTFSSSRPRARFYQEEKKGYVINSYMSRRDNFEQVSNSLPEFLSDSYRDISAKYGYNPECNIDRKSSSSHCKS